MISLIRILIFSRHGVKRLDQFMRIKSIMSEEIYGQYKTRGSFH